MKTRRIILWLTGAIALIGIIWHIFHKPAPEPETSPPVQVINPYVERIENEIDSLDEMANYEFSTDLSKTIQYHINDGFENNLFGSNENDNTQWRNVLSEKLFYTYSQKFIEQAFVVFSSYEWETTKLNIIIDETPLLQKSRYLGKENPVSDKLDEILEILKQYRVILNFIHTANSYMNTGAFDYNRSMSYLTAAQKYQDQNLGNKYVNNCRSLHAGLYDLQRLAYIKHQNYVVEKYNENLNKYRTVKFSGTSWAQQASDYRNKIFDPVLEELQLFEKRKSGYRFITYEIDLKSLKNNWENELNKAINYFKSNTP